MLFLPLALKPVGSATGTLPSQPLFIIRNFSINPGRWGLFLEERITHDGNGYVHRTGISNNVTADKCNFERKKRFVEP